jgi:hypothetical protein
VNGTDQNDHPAPKRLESFMRGELARSEASGLVRHLLTGCSRCVEVTRQFWTHDELTPQMVEQRRTAAARRPEREHRGSRTLWRCGVKV